MKQEETRTAPWTFAADTWRAQLAFQRSIPVAILGSVLLVAQYEFEGSLLSVEMGGAMILAFCACSPVGYRALVGNPERRSVFGPYLGFVLYVLYSAVIVFLVGAGFPSVLRVGPTFLTADPSLVVAVGLFVVGGLGIGRDIDLEARSKALAREAERAELLALRANLDPHFLFNTLNALAEWCREDGATAERGILALSALLHSLHEGVRAPGWPLARELELVRAVFSLYQLRDAARFDVQYRLADPIPDVEVPPLLFLPLAENAMTHGPEAGHRGTVRCVLEHDATSVRFSLWNPGKFTGRRRDGQGLEVTERRLRLAYGPDASLRIESESDGTLAEISLRRGAPIRARV